MKSFTATFLTEMRLIADQLLVEGQEVIERMLQILHELKARQGRLFIIGVGGGAGTGSHAANDFMKIGGIATINLSDNASLVTALANDEGWDSIFIRQLVMHHFTKSDCLLVFSVGGGTATTSPNLVTAINHARALGAPIIGVVGKADGHAAHVGTAVLVIPTVAEERRTAHTESWQLVLNHLLVNALASHQSGVPVVTEKLVARPAQV